MGQDATANQTAQLAFVRALANGTAVIDETRTDLGNIVTSDVDFFEGHYYAAKAPGLAFTTLPLFLVLERAGMRTSGDPARLLWALGLLGSALPAALLLLMVSWLGERLTPGLGTAVAVTLGLGTMLLPYASMFFAHALSATLAFGAFVLLWRERHSATRTFVVGIAGLIAGCAISVEYQNAIVASVLGVYAISRGDPVRRGILYASGVLVGMVPMLAYNWITFGSPLQFMHGYAATTQGPSVPDFSAMVMLLFGFWGLLAASPVVAAGAFGTVLLFRRGERAEAAVIAAVCLLFLAFNSGAQQLTGGLPGTRYLIVILPFVIAPLGLALERLPLTTVALSCISICAMVGMTATRPIIADDGRLLDRLTNADGSAPTALDFVGITGWYDIAPFYVFVAAAVIFAVAATRISVTPAEAWVAVAVIAAYFVALRVSPVLSTKGFDANLAAAAFLTAVSAFVAVIALAVRKQGLDSPQLRVRDLKAHMTRSTEFE
jgi:hypothetical protein